METPTFETIQALSMVEMSSAKNGQFLVDVAVNFVEGVTGRKLDASMPTEFDEIALAVVQRLTEVSFYQSSPDFIETISDFGIIASFSAGNYSETRRGLDELRKSGMVVPDPYLNSLLWGLMTPDKQDEWIAWTTGKPLPDFEVTEIAWNADAGSSYIEGEYGQRYVLGVVD